MRTKGLIRLASAVWVGVCACGVAHASIVRAEWNIRAVHMMLLPKGDLLVWEYGTSPDPFDPLNGPVFGSSTPEASLIQNPSSTVPWSATSPSGFRRVVVPIDADPNSINPANPEALDHRNIFCAGHIQTDLTDRPAIIMGGDFHRGLNKNAGAKIGFFFQADATNPWVRTPNLKEFRWYPTLKWSDPRRLYVFSGSTLDPHVQSRSSEMWIFPENAALPPYGVKLGWNSWHGEPNLMWHYYPFVFPVPDTPNEFFIPGQNTRSVYLNLARMEFEGSSEGDPDGAFGFDYPSAAMVDGKVLVSGGSAGDIDVPATNRFGIVNLNSEAIWEKPQQHRRWIKSETATMKVARKNHVLVVLPNRRVLAIGGNRRNFTEFGTGHPERDIEVFTFNDQLPAGGEWKFAHEVAGENPVNHRLTIDRGYHMTSLLLPSGRVVIAGGDGYDPSNPFWQPGMPDMPAFQQGAAEIYTPSWLKGARPALNVTGVPNQEVLTWTYGTRLPVTIRNNGTTFKEVVLMKMGSVTHAYDMGQTLYSVPIDLDRGAANRKGAQVTGELFLEDRPWYVEPGYYMLFAVAEDGSYSAGCPVRISSDYSSEPFAQFAVNLQDAFVADEWSDWAESHNGQRRELAWMNDGRDPGVPQPDAPVGENRIVLRNDPSNTAPRNLGFRFKTKFPADVPKTLARLRLRLEAKVVGPDAVPIKPVVFMMGADDEWTEVYPFDDRDPDRDDHELLFKTERMDTIKEFRLSRVEDALSESMEFFYRDGVADVMVIWPDVPVGCRVEIDEATIRGFRPKPH